MPVVMLLKHAGRHAAAGFSVFCQRLAAWRINAVNYCFMPLLCGLSDRVSGRNVTGCITH